MTRWQYVGVFGLLLMLVFPIHAQDVTGSMLGPVNQARANASVPPVAYNSSLAAAAQAHSNDMAAGGFLSHTGSDGSQFWERMRANGYPMTTGAENVLYRWDADVNAAFQQWLNSPGHRTNMLNRAYTEVGVAYAVAGDGRYFFTMVLGDRPGAPNPSVAPPTDVPPTDVPPTDVPPTDVPPTDVPPTDVPPTDVPPTDVPPTDVPPTDVPPTDIAPTDMPPTDVPPTDVAPTDMPLPQASITVDVASGDVTADFLPLVNDARARMGSPPLTYHPQLASAAQAHSSDMAAGGFMSHRGTDGSEFWERMQAAGYPSTTGAENVLYRGDADVAAAFQQWMNSSGHRINMLNSRYVELGVAYAEGADGGYYFTMVLGYRSDADVSRFQPPPTSTPLPPVSDAVQQNGPAPTVPPTQQPRPTVTPLVISPMPDTPQPPVVSPVLTLQPTIVAASPQPDLTSEQNRPPDLQLTWDNTSFALLNVAGVPLDLSGVTFESDNGTLPIAEWQTEYLTASLFNFPDAGCLQVWGLGISALPSKPSACQFRHAWIAVDDSKLFWQGISRFTVLRDGVPVALCSTMGGTCDVSLAPPQGDLILTPQPASQPTPVSVVPAGEAPNVRLLYDAQSLTLLNISGAPVNLAELRLQSASGSLSIYDWDTEYLTASLSGFPANDCLQAWNANTPTQPKPPACQTRHAWIGVSAPMTMWVDVPQFTVSQRGVVVATCDTSAGVCEFRAS